MALEDEDLGVMEQAVDGGAGQERIVEERRPLLERTLTPANVANPPLAAVRAAKARTAQAP
jgi:hypothetical protein